ncbi:MAG: response regulator transcription factor [Deltaproteobacteria bacterium]|jgi:two-component system OmpR family response regulator|nr:response regulator transcription factor [Deltaproteobacteria bacterium]
MSDAASILIVDDDREIRELLEENLANFGFRPVAVANGREMFNRLESGKYDLVLLDVMLPEEDGLALCRRLRTPGASYEHTPVIFLTALGDITDRVVGLELGGDDYLPKPFQMRELVARIRALLRRSSISSGAGNTPETAKPRTHGIWSFGRWRLNVLARNLVDQDEVVTPMGGSEFKLLMLFLENPQKVISREDILEHMAERAADVYDRSIDVQVSRLRAKLQDDARNPELIRTLRGDGYMLTAPVERSGS